MKRYGNLFDTICSFESLCAAERKARKGKRARAEVSEYRLTLESNLLALSDRLQTRQYVPGAFFVFNICDPKARVIAAPPYEDRIVQHALCAVIEPIFDRTFQFDSFACRHGKGTHAALDRLGALMRSDDYVLHCDVRAFFPSIRHSVLKDLIRRKIKCSQTLWLCDSIIDSSNSLTPIVGVGLPIGSLTSQLFANVMLNQLDSYVKQGLRAERYVRYCDDFLILSADKAQLAEHRQRIERFLAESLDLELHPTKRQIYPCRTGVAFVGFRSFPSGHRRLLPGNGRRFARRLRGMSRAITGRKLTVAQALTCVTAWQAHAAHGHTVKLQRSILKGCGAAWATDIAARATRRFLEQY